MLTVTIAEEGSQARLVASGEVDLDTAPSLADAGESLNGARQVVIDLEAVTFMDSWGLRAVLGLAQEWSEQGRAVSVACTDERLLRLFEVAGVHSTRESEG